MFRKAFKTLGLSLVALAIVGGVLYQFFGLRVVLDGGGMPRLRFVESADAQAERIRQHREAQRAQFAAEAPPGASTEPPADGLVKDESPGVAAGRTEPATAVVPGTPAPGASSYWSDFRGPLRDGIYREQPVLTAWPPSGLKPLWKQPAGGGYASFVIAQGRAYTIEQRGPDEVAAAYDVATGRELWTSAWRADFRESMGGDGPRATPTWADGSLYVLGAEGELRALDAASGRLTWRTNILEDVGRTARRGRPRDRPAGRVRRPFGGGLRPAYGKTRLVGARRSHVVRLPDAGHAARRPPDSGVQRLAARGHQSTGRRAAVGVPMARPEPYQCGSTAGDWERPDFHILGLWNGSGCRRDLEGGVRVLGA
jgi:hypothetical protein